MTSTPGDGQDQTPPPGGSGEEPTRPLPQDGGAAEPGWQPQWQPQYPSDPGTPGYPPPAGGYAAAPPPAGGYAYVAPDHPRATLSLVLGIIGLVSCQILSPFAWVIGKKAVAEIDAAPGRYGGRGQAQAGYILGLVGTILLALGLVFVLVWVVFVVGAIGFSSFTS